MKKLLSVVVGAALMLAACGGNSHETTLSWWQFWTSPDVKPTIIKLVSDFEHANPEVKIDIGELTWSDGHEKIAIALASGEGPDVIELGSDWVAEFAAEGRLLNLTEKSTALRSRLQMWEPAMYEGQVYAVPWMLGTRVLFCNRALLTAAGYDSTFVPQSWDQLLEAAKKVNNLGDERFGFGSNSAERHRLYKKFLPFFWTAGGEVFAEDGGATRFNSPAGLQALEYYLALSGAGIIETQARLEEYFAAGQVAFVISGEWLVRKLQANAGEIDYSVTTMPGLTEGEVGLSFAGGEYLVINADSENPGPAFDLINHLVRTDSDLDFAAATGSFTPVNAGTAPRVTEELAAVAAVFQLQLAHAKSTPVHPQWVQIEEILEHGIEQALYGKLTAAEALQSIDTECAKVLARDAER